MVAHDVVDDRFAGMSDVRRGVHNEARHLCEHGRELEDTKHLIIKVSSQLPAQLYERLLPTVKARRDHLKVTVFENTDILIFTINLLKSVISSWYT